jgi:hypothetical protein
MGPMRCVCFLICAEPPVASNHCNCVGTAVMSPVWIHSTSSCVAIRSFTGRGDSRDHAKDNVCGPTSKPFPSRSLSYADPVTLIVPGVIISQEGHEPLHLCIRRHPYGRELSDKTVDTLQALVAFGATWDAKCDELVSGGEASEEARALCICVLPALYKSSVRGH